MRINEPLHHRRSIRLKGVDYSHPGIFFITICAFQREELFGKVMDGEMQLSPLGKIVRTEWFRSAEVCKEIQLFKTEFAVMPNHIHGIVWIVEDGAVGTPRSLDSFVTGFKAAVTSRAGNELNSANLWQPNYYEHMIRSKDELQDIRVYIQANPQRWQADQLHPCAQPNRFNQDEP